MLKRRIFIIALALSASSPCLAELARSNIGTLTCTLQNGGDGSATPQGQTRDMSCAFQATQGSDQERYIGTIRKAGAGQSLSGKLVLVWSVAGTERKGAAAGFLEQTYTGGEGPAPASAAPGALIGERDQSLALVPLTNTDSARLPAAAPNITVIELKYAAVRT